MKKEVMIIFLFGILTILPLVLAQEQVQTYSGVDRFTDNIKMFFASGEGEVELALKIREKEVNSAIINSQNENEKEAIKNLERAHQRLQFINGKVSLDVVDEVKENVDEVVSKIENEEDLSDNFDVYVLAEKKTQLTAILTEKTYEYCSELAKEDFALMLKDEECNPETAPEPLKKDLEKLKDLQERMFVKLMLEIRSCMDDPGTCNCEANVDIEQKAKCEKMVALALKCEYQDDETSCNDLNSLGALNAESFVPKFLMNLFRAKEEQMLWGESPSDCVPEECWDENDKPECRQYDKFKETKDDWDEYGNFIGPKNKCGRGRSIPTMQESIPQCFDGDVFLEEKCGEITMVENEEGLINYIIGNEINGIIGEFENKSEQHLMEIRNGWMMVDNKWVIDSGQVNSENGTMNGEQNQTGNNIWEIKEEINTIDKNIKDWVVDHPVGDVEGDDGLTWEIKTGVGTGDDGFKTEIKTGDDGGNGNDGFTTEVKTAGNSGGHEENNVIEERDSGNGEVVGNGGSVSGDTHEVVEGDGGEGDYAEGTSGGGSEGENTVAP